MSGFILIHRKILEWEWYHDVNVKLLFLHFLLKANWKEGRFKGRVINRGSFVTSIEVLSKELRMTVQQVRTAIKKLKSTNEITSESTNNYTIITVCNYELYQTEQQTEQQSSNKRITNEQQTNNKPITNEQQTDNKRITTIEQRNKETKEQGNKGIREQGNKETKKSSLSSTSLESVVSEYTNSQELIDAINAFIEMRKGIKKPLTQKALQLMLSKLETLGHCESERIQILNNSIMNSWQGIFELKPEQRNAGKGYISQAQQRLDSNMEAARSFVQEMKELEEKGVSDVW